MSADSAFGALVVSAMAGTLTYFAAARWLARRRWERIKRDRMNRWGRRATPPPPRSAVAGEAQAKQPLEA